MNKQEIEKLTRLQNHIDETQRNIERVNRHGGVTLWADGNAINMHYIYQPFNATLRECALDMLNEVLADLIYKRDELIICKGNAEYKPTNILEEE